MQTVNFFLKFKIGHCHGQSMEMRIEVNDALVVDVREFDQTDYEITLPVMLPGIVKISLAGKDMSKDTILDDRGGIVEDKFIKVVQARFGHVSIDEHQLFKLCECDFQSGKKHDTYWGEPGEVTMRFSTETVVEWHLRNLING